MIKFEMVLGFFAKKQRKPSLVSADAVYFKSTVILFRFILFKCWRYKNGSKQRSPHKPSYQSAVHDTHTIFLYKPWKTIKIQVCSVFTFFYDLYRVFRISSTSVFLGYLMIPWIWHWTVSELKAIWKLI